MTKTIYPVTAGPVPTNLTATYTYGDVGLALETMTDVPAAPNIITVFDSEGYYITVKYEALSGTNTLTQLTFIDGSSTHTFYQSKSQAVRTICKYDFDALSEWITKLSTEKLDNTFPLDKSGKYLRVAPDGTLTYGDGGGGGEGSATILKDTVVPIASWVSSTELEDYGYQASIHYQDATVHMAPSITYSAKDADTGNFAPTASTNTQEIIIYAKAIPQTEIVIPTIILQH